MPKGNLTLLDLAMRGGENVAAVVEDVVTVAPEWGIIPAAPRLGTSYEVLRRTSLPSGGFRKVGDGVVGQKSGFERETKPMFVFEAQMNVGEDIVKAQTAASRSTVGDVLADEAIAHVQGSAITMGSQVYYGKKANADGFAGLAAQVSDEESAGGGAGADTTSAYLLWVPPVTSESDVPKGVHFAVGLDGSFQFGDWMKQQVDKGNNKKAMEYVNNFMFYVGLATASAYSVFRVRNIKEGSALTPTMGYKLLKKVPIARRGNLIWVMNRTAQELLRQSLITNEVKDPPLPEKLCGIPITVTDSIVDTEKNGDLA